MIEQPGAAMLPAIARTLAQERLRLFRKATQGNNRTALEMYVVDAKLASHFHATLRATEILLREHMHRALSDAFTTRWFDVLAQRGDLDPRSVKKIQDAKRSARAGMSPPAGKVVAQLTFGAWVDLLDRGGKGQYEALVWPVLTRVFEARGDNPGRAAVHEIAKRLSWARNRVNHCEPVIFGFPLVGQRTPDRRQRRRAPALVLDDARVLAGMIDRDFARWLCGWKAIDSLIRDPLAQQALDYMSTQRGIVLER